MEPTVSELQKQKSMEPVAKTKSINDYKFMKSIGEGAFGKVYMAIEKET